VVANLVASWRQQAIRDDERFPEEIERFPGSAALVSGMKPTPTNPPSESIRSIEAAIDGIESWLGELRDALPRLMSGEGPAPAAPQERRLLTVQEAAERLGVGETTVRALIRSFQLRSVKIGTARRVPVDDIEDFLARLRESGEVDV
jgi:excisionase family DNA binding protein